MPVSSTWPPLLLAIRSLAWVILLPGVMAGYVPWRYFGARWSSVEKSPASIIGLSFVAIGVAILSVCVWEFAYTGHGTLSPADPPKHLVVRGLYRYVRNPMYVAVFTVLFGEVLVVRSSNLAEYWIAWFVGANVFIMGYEEPHLRRRFGLSYAKYTERVGRWIPTLRER